MKPTSIAKPTQDASLEQGASIKPGTMKGDEKYGARRKEAKEEEVRQAMKRSK